MNSLEQFAFVVVGVAVAVVLPVVADKVRKYFPQTAAVGFKPPEWVMRYIWLGIFSVAVAGVIFAGWKQQHPTGGLEWYSAFLLGYTSEASIEKILRPKAYVRLSPEQKKA
jgi:tryptophan-rich sensory protein